MTMHSSIRLAPIAVLLALTALGDCAPQTRKPAPLAIQPAEIVREFYHWYLKALAQNKDPVSQDQPTLRRFLSAGLLAEIDRRMKSPDGMEADYFIQAQDYLDEWLEDIVAVPVDTSSRAATVDVSLGAKVGKRYQLRVTLSKFADSWKISRVERERR